MTNLNVIKAFMAGIPAVSNSKRNLESTGSLLYSFGKKIAVNKRGRVYIVEENETGSTYSHIELLKICMGDKYND